MKHNNTLGNNKKGKSFISAFFALGGAEDVDVFGLDGFGFFDKTPLAYFEGDDLAFMWTAPVQAMA